MNHDLLQHLWTIQDWNRLESKSREFLQQDPADTYAQFAFAIALIKLHRLADAARSIQILADCQGANSINFHWASASYWMARNRYDYAWYHAYQMIELDPKDASLWQQAAGILLAIGKAPEAYGAALRARSLDPNSTSGAEVESLILAANSKTADDLVRLQSTLDHALAVAPESARIHKLRGDLKQFALADRKSAIEHYRTALASNPLDADCQQKLIELIPVSNIFVWALFLPLLVARRVFQTANRLRVRFFFVLVLALMAVAVLSLWLVPALVLFLIPALCYEYFFVADVSVLAIRSRPLRWLMMRLQKIPFMVRILGICAIWIALICIPLWLFGIAIQVVLLTSVSFYLCHLILIGCWIGIKRLDWWIANQGQELPIRTRLGRLLVVGMVLNTFFVALYFFWIFLVSDRFESFTIPVAMINVTLYVMANAAVILKMFDCFRRYRFDRRVRAMRLPKPKRIPPMP